MARNGATPMDMFLARFVDDSKDEEEPPAMPPPHLQIGPLSRPLVPAKIISDLHADVAAQIVKYQSTAELPPFSITQLAVMLLIYYGPLHQYDIFPAIMTTFPFYYDQATGSPGFRALNQARGPLTPHIQFHHTNDIFPEIQQIAQSFAAPLLESNTTLLVINLREARIFLRECLESAKGTTGQPFRFLDLPAELRVRIYEYALAYPKSGVAVDIPISKQESQDYRPANAAVFTRDYDRTFELFQCISSRGWQLINLPPLHKVLALLQVSKLLYKEAMPVFFTQNKFVVRDIAMLRPFLERLSIERRKCIQDLAVGYNEDGMHQAAAGFRLLKTTGLRHLELHVNEYDFDDISNDKGVLLYTDMTRLPGFHTLSHIKGLETLNVDGDCDTIREHFMKVLAASKAKEDQKKAKKGPGPKRKVGAGQTKTKKKSKVKVEDEDEDGSL